MTLEYTIDLDHRTWVPVPLAFPWNGFPDAAAWAHGLATDLMSGIDAPAEVRDQLEATARVMAEVQPPLPGALERFWHLPEGGGPERLVHLYVTTTDATTAEQLAQLARAGVGGMIQTVTVLEDTAFDVALLAVVVTELPDRSVAVLRAVGVRAEYVFVVELIEEDAVVLEQLQPTIAELFRSIRLRTDGGGAVAQPSGTTPGALS
jgi:hypothetical protein